MHHDLRVVLEPEQHRLRVEDRITVPERFLDRGRLPFLLHRNLMAVVASPGAELLPAEAVADPEPFTGLEAEVPLVRYTLILPPGEHTVALRYQGAIHHELRVQGEEYARGFSETPGSIAQDGIFLAESSYWYPQFDNALVTFTLAVRLPEGWDAVSQGSRTRHMLERGWREVRWESPQPQDAIYLVGGRFTQYTREAGPVQAMVFLGTPDQPLAERYLDATTQYLEMYSELLGPYPYAKFALVENAWETGYGMPSFTLLGPKVIRLPFLLHTSYPHEILHNWWGNGVFVDDREGNWAEGLTAYLADHLTQERRGRGAEHRRTALQNYADAVAHAEDFPLSAFRARHSPASEAVGYGKAMLFFHMLRRRLGDGVFITALRDFYREHRFERAAFADLQAAFARHGDGGLEAEFRQWVTRTGAPELQVTGVQAARVDNAFLLKAVLEQTQPGPP